MRKFIFITLVLLVSPVRAADDSIQIHLACDPKTECNVIPAEGGQNIHLEKKASLNFAAADVVSVEARRAKDWEVFTIQLSDQAGGNYRKWASDNAGVNMGIIYEEKLLAFGGIPAGAFKGALEIQTPSTGPQSLRNVAWIAEKIDSTLAEKIRAKKFAVTFYAVVMLLALGSAIYWIGRRDE